MQRNYNPGLLPQKYNSGASYLNADVIAASGPLRLWGVSGYNSKNAAVFVMLFDAVAVPATGTAPDVLIYVPAGSGFAWRDSDHLGTAFNNGLVWAESSTAPGLTLAGSSDVYLRADLN